MKEKIKNLFRRKAFLLIALLCLALPVFAATVIKSGATTDQLTVDATSKAARVTLYNSDGTYSGQKATYRASTIIPFVPAVTVNRTIFTIGGSASKVVTVKKIRVSGFSLTAVAYGVINVVKYSTATSGGTATNLTAVPLDSTSGAATAAQIKVFTAVPTDGALVGHLASWRSLWQATTAAAAGVTFDHIFDFGNTPGSSGIVLRGTSQECAMLFSVAPASTPTLALDVEWTEE